MGKKDLTQPMALGQSHLSPAGILQGLAGLGNRHEHVYPLSNGIGGVTGGPVMATTDQEDDAHAAGTDQWYWGAPGILVPVSTILTAWLFIGNYVYANVANKEIQAEMLKIDPVFSTTLDLSGASPAENVIELEVADGSIFAVNDLIWITSATYPNGEIQKISNIATNTLTFGREGDQCGCAGLRWPHDDLVTTKFYLCRREAAGWHGQQIEFSASSIKDFMIYRWHNPIYMPASSGLLARAMNESDGTTVTADIKTIYDEG